MVHEQAAGFALDALDGDELLDFERHLEGCPGCEDELEPLRLAAVALAFAGELPPPRPELRRRVLKVDAVVLPFRRRAQPFVSAAAVAAACAAVVLSVWAWAEEGSPDVGGTRDYALHGAEGGLLVADGGEAVLVVRHLPPAPAGKAYEVWVVQEGRPAAAGLLRGSLVELTRPVPRGARVMVTLEPARGSSLPSGPLLIRAETA